MTGNNNSNYLSLKAAAQQYGYTRDHLGLMIRQGKLQGVKLGSYYVTTGEWMAKYIKNYADPAHPAAKNKLSNRFIAQILSGIENKPAPAIRIKGAAGPDSGSNFSTDMRKELEFSLAEIEQKAAPVVSEFSKSGGSIANNQALRRTPLTVPVFQSEHFEPIAYPYAILPIRKMEAEEKEEILRKISGQDSSEINSETV